MIGWDDIVSAFATVASDTVLGVPGHPIFTAGVIVKCPGDEPCQLLPKLEPWELLWAVYGTPKQAAIQRPSIIDDFDKWFAWECLKRNVALRCLGVTATQEKEYYADFNRLDPLTLESHESIWLRKQGIPTGAA